MLISLGYRSNELKVAPDGKIAGTGRDASRQNESTMGSCRLVSISTVASRGFQMPDW